MGIAKKLLIIALIFAGYLYLAHAYIYFRIGSASLPPVDFSSLKAFGGSAAAEKLVYASLGDSLTAGVGAGEPGESYPYLVAQKLSGPDRQVELKNFSYPGARSADLIKDLLAPAIAADPDVVTVLIGVNDVHGLVGVKEFSKNYGYIIKTLAAQTNARIFAVSIPYIGANSLVLPPYGNYYDYRTAEFNKIIQELAKDNGIYYIDLYGQTARLFKKNGGHYSADLFHPSAKGYELWAQIIYDNLDH